jgi:transposase-like protein
MTKEEVEEEEVSRPTGPIAVHVVVKIVRKLREVEAALATGSTVPQAVRQIGISEQTYYRWRKLYGKMEKDQLRRLKTLEVENRRLKKIVADQALDLQIVKEALEGKY